MDHAQGPGQPPGLEGIPWPLTKEAAADLGLPAPDHQKVPLDANPRHAPLDVDDMLCPSYA